MSSIDAWTPHLVQLIAVVTGLTMAAMLLAAMYARRGAVISHSIWLSALIAILLSPLAIFAASRAGLRLATISIPWPEKTNSASPSATAPFPPRIEREELPPIQLSRSQPERPEFANLQEVIQPEAPSWKLAMGREPTLSAAAVDHRTVAAAESEGTQFTVVQTTSKLAILGRYGVTAWAIGILLLLVRFVRGWFLLHVLRRSARLADERILGEAVEQARLRLGVDRMPPIAVSARLLSPVAVGWHRPLVILPDGLADHLSASELANVLVHESAHIFRRDSLVGLVQRLAEIIYWPHPLVHLLNRRLAWAREEICDNHVLKQGDACAFARTLLAIAENAQTFHRPTGSLPLLNAGWKLEDRVAGLLDPRRKPVTRMSRVHLSSLVAVMFVTGTALAGLRIEASGRTEQIKSDLENEPGRSSPRVELKPTQYWRQFHGRVVRATDGKPCKNVSVRLVRDWKARGPRSTGEQGAFTIDVRGPLLGNEELIAESSDGLLLGSATFQEPLDSQVRTGDIEIRLEPCRTVNVFVHDSKGTSVPGARVDVVADCGSIGSSNTNSHGEARLRFPAGQRIFQIIAFKPGSGFDYFENFTSWPSSGRTDVPETVSLVLEGAQTAKIKAIDSSGKAIAGVGFYVQSIKKKGKLSSAMVPGTHMVSTTDARGIAGFDWLPTAIEEPVQVQLWPGDWHAPIRPTFPVAEIPTETTVRLVRKSIIQGKVLHSNSTPAGGILVQAGGVGKDIADEYDHAAARTAADGTYALAVAPEHSYMVGVCDGSWAARSLTNIVPRREGEAHDVSDLYLNKGTVVQGQVTRGPNKQPVAGAWVILHEDGDALPSDYQPFTSEGREWLSRIRRTDMDGRYSIRVGPGEYRLTVNHGHPEAIKITIEETITRDRLLDGQEEPGERKIEGLVLESAADGAKPEAGAWVWDVSPESGGQQHTARTNAAGTFEILTRSNLLTCYARNPDGSRAGFAELKVGQSPGIIHLAEASSVSGRVVMQDDRPAAGKRVHLQLRPGIQHKLSGKFAIDTRTDAQGRYLFVGVLPGTRCVLSVEQDDSLAGVIKEQPFVVQSSRPFRLGDIVLAASAKERPTDGTTSKSAPAAAQSRPLTVLSGPSRSEISDLIRAIGRDPISAELVDRIAATYHPRHLWPLDYARMMQVATDPQAVKHLDVLANDVRGKPLNTFMLLRLAMIHHVGYDDTMMKQFLREWTAEENLPGVTIRGTVLDEATQQPIPYPRVYSDNSMAAADEHGRFELTTRKKADADHDLVLWVEADGHASGEFLVKKNEHLRIALRCDAPLFGKVVDHEGKPVEGAEVRANVHRALMVLGDSKAEEFHGGSHAVFQVRTDREGRFSFQGVPATDLAQAQALELEATLLRFLKRDHEFNNPRWPFVVKVRDVVGKTLIDATFMKRASGKPENTFNATIKAERAEVHFDLVTKIIQLKLEHAEGQFFGPGVLEVGRNSLGADRISLEFPFPENSLFVFGEQSILLEVTHPRFQTSNSRTSAPTRADAVPLIRLQPGSGVTVQVLDERDNPIADAMVQVRDASGRDLVTTYTDREAGLCQTPTILKPGRYTVVVQSANHAPAWRTIVVGEVLSAHQFVLELGGYITGKVLSASGEPVTNAAVGWVQPLTADRQASRGVVLNTMTTTNTDGTFRLGPLPVGEFEITALAESPRRKGKTTAKVNGTALITISPE